MSVRGLRWWIAGLVFLATLINFLDRLTISVLAPVITVQLGLTNLQFAGISTSFLLAYAASQGLSGSLFDRIGTRRGFTVAVTVWSAAAIGHAFARGIASLSLLRFLLGLGEDGNWPGGAKVLAKWFPERERALGMAILNSGSTLGSVIAPPLIVWLQLRFGWRTMFLATGLLGFGWLILWRLFYETPNRHPSLSREEYVFIHDDRPLAADARGSDDDVRLKASRSGGTGGRAFHPPCGGCRQASRKRTMCAFSRTGITCTTLSI